jgi:hypothetical protein
MLPLVKGQTHRKVGAQSFRSKGSSAYDSGVTGETTRKNCGCEP